MPVVAFKLLNAVGTVGDMIGMHVVGSRHLGAPERRPECPPSDWVALG